MKHFQRPIVLVHGLWDTPKVFNRLVRRIEQINPNILIPSLPHKMGRVPIQLLAEKLDAEICKCLGPDIEIDLLGFSMGGLIGRFWLQKLNGAARTNRFLSVGSPHKGTYTASFMPSCLLAGVAQMKPGSTFLNDLNLDISSLDCVECSSFFCRGDLMVLPGWEAVLPVGTRYDLPVLTHKQLILHPLALDVLIKKLTA